MRCGVVTSHLLTISTRSGRCHARLPKPQTLDWPSGQISPIDDTHEVWPLQRAIGHLSRIDHATTRSSSPPVTRTYVSEIRDRGSQMMFIKCAYFQLISAQGVVYAARMTCKSEDRAERSTGETQEKRNIGIYLKDLQVWRSSSTQHMVDY